MPFKRAPKPKKCSVCYSPLAGKNVRLGCCDTCVGKALKKLKRRVALGALVGAALMAAYLLFAHYAKANHILLHGGSDMGLPTFFGHITFNGRLLGGIIHQTLPWRLVTAAILFLLPFGAFVKLQTQTFRHDSQEHAARLDPFAGKMIAGAQYHRMDDIGLFTLSALLFLISGPFCFAYRLYKLGQLSRYRATMDA